MVHLVSRGANKAEVILEEMSGTRRTLHLIQTSSGRWTDRWGTLYNLDKGDVDYFLYYRNKLEWALRADMDLVPDLVRWTIHAYHQQHPEEEGVVE